MPDLREALEQAFEEEEKEVKEKTPVLEEKSVDPEPAVANDVPDTTPSTKTLEGIEGSDKAPEKSENQSAEETPGVKVSAEEAEKALPDDLKFLPPEGALAGEAPTLVDSSERAPASWRGAAKQHWGELPTDVRQEVMRRERQVNDVLRESSDARRFVDAFEETVQPFQSFIAADGENPLQATRNLMQAAATLRAGTPDQKVALAYDIIKRYGVDINALDSMLAGETPAPAVAPGNGGVPAEDPIMQYIDRRLAPVTQVLQGLQLAQANRYQAFEADVDAEVDAFEADPNNLFLEDVREDMAVLLESAAAQNRNMTIEQAYNAALTMRPELAKVQNQRRSAQTAATREEALQRKKMAAASVKGTSVSPTSSAATDIRGQINEAWDLHGGGS